MTSIAEIECFTPPYWVVVNDYICIKDMFEGTINIMLTERSPRITRTEHMTWILHWRNVDYKLTENNYWTTVKKSFHYCYIHPEEGCSTSHFYKNYVSYNSCPDCEVYVVENLEQVEQRFSRKALNNLGKLKNGQYVPYVTVPEDALYASVWFVNKDGQINLQTECDDAGDWTITHVVPKAVTYYPQFKLWICDNKYVLKWSNHAIFSQYIDNDDPYTYCPEHNWFCCTEECPNTAETPEFHETCKLLNIQTHLPQPSGNYQ